MRLVFVALLVATGMVAASEAQEDLFLSIRNPANFSETLIVAYDPSTGGSQVVTTVPVLVESGEGVFDPVAREYRFTGIQTPLDSNPTIGMFAVNVDTGVFRPLPLNMSGPHALAQGLTPDPRIDEAFAAIEATAAETATVHNDLNELAVAAKATAAETATVRDDLSELEVTTKATAAETAALRDGLSELEVTARAAADETAAVRDGLTELEDRTAELESRISDNAEGVAMALAMDTPDFAGDEGFGVKVNWGQFDGEHAFAGSMAGVLGRNLFSSQNRLTVDVGVGLGTRGNVGTRAGGQLTW